jgi:hypothetical protein
MKSIEIMRVPSGTEVRHWMDSMELLNELFA